MSWKSALSPVEVILPSGNIAHIKSISVESLILSGKIPDILISAVIESLGMNSSQKGTDEERFSLFKNQILFMKVAVSEMLVFPKVVENGANPDEGTILYEDIDTGDVYFLFGLLNKPVQELESFRKK